MPNENKLFIYLLGKAEIRPANAAPVKFNQNKSLALLAYLATTKRVHSRAELAGLLWSKSSEANARASLRKVLADLRPYVAKHLTITHQELAFNTSSPYWLDVQAFEQHIVTSQRSQKANRVLMPKAASTLAQATDLYRENFLTGLYVKHAPAFEEWVFVQRERFRLMALRALHTLSAYYMAQGQYADAINSISHLLTLEPCQEDAHRQLMSILALSGQREAALKQYDVCRQILAEELDIAPQDETTALYERIRTSAALTMSPQPMPTFATTVPLVGREQEIADILEYLKSPECRLLTLLGIGGIGKTRLAQEVMARLSKGKASRTTSPEVYFMHCAAVQSEPAFLPTLAQSIHFYFASTENPHRQLLNYMCDKRFVLILDNFEHLLTIAPSALNVIRDILNTALGIKILITSRSRLNLQAEYLYRLNGLRVPTLTDTTPTEPIIWRDYGALKLFIRQMRQIQPHQEITKDALMHIIRICQFVQGMPLAILLAASWTQILHPAEIDAHLTGDANTTSDTLDFLTTDLADIPEQHRSMRAIFDHSWQLLPEQERQLLAGLTVFHDDFTYTAAKHICQASLPRLASLVNHSLLQRNVDGRYEMHALLHQYAREKLHAMPDYRKRIAEQHSRYFCQQLQQWSVDLKGAQQQAALVNMDKEITNLRTAWDWAVTHQQWELVNQAMEGLCYYHEWRGRFQEGATVCQHAIDCAEQTNTTLSQEPNGIKEKVLAYLWIWFHVFTKISDVAMTFQKSLSLLEKAQRAGQDVRKEKAFVLLWSGISKNGDETMYKQSLALYQQLEATWETTQVLDAWAWLAWSRGDYAQTERMHKQSLALRQDLGDQKGIANNYLWLGIAAVFQGRREGKHLLHKALNLYQDHSNRADAVGWLTYASTGLMALGEFDEAHKLLQYCVSINTDLGVIDHTANIFLGSAKIQLGDYKQGQDLVQAGLEISEATHDYAAVTYSCLVLGWVALVNKDYMQALNLCEKSAAICRQGAQYDMLSLAIGTMGYAYCGLRQLESAKQHFRQALSIAQELQSVVAYQFISPGIVWLLKLMKKHARAAEVLALCQDLPMIANSHWLKDIMRDIVPSIDLASNISTTEGSNRLQDLEQEILKLQAKLQ